MIYAVYESISGYVFSSIDIFPSPSIEFLFIYFGRMENIIMKMYIMMNGHKELSEEELDLD
jgi:hypothetical protein